IAAMRLVFGGRPQPFRLATGAIVLGAASVLLALTREFPIALGLMVVIGFGSILMAATANTTIQLAVPDHLRGRIMSVYTTTFAASIPIGGLIMGAVASALGVPAAIGIGGVLSLVIGLAAVAWRRGGAFDLPIEPAAAPMPSGATLTGRPATGRPAPR
nr:MFS transporter [Chloroflexota bacterium]